MHFTTLVTSLALFSTTGWAGYVLEDDYFANNFFDQFSFWSTADPTNGFVAYQGQESAQSMGLINSTAGNIQMSVDSTNQTPNGRPSVRITSNKSYSSGLVVVDIAHMPGGTCGTWPAFWTVGPNWPNGGEIDIFEGVNDQTTNDITLHTGPGCSVSDNGGFTGNLKHTTCASSPQDNTGCQIGSSDTKSYGPGFNANGGGVYATEWTGTYIAVYFFPRGSIPDDVLGDSPNPAGWGTPTARFSGDCDMSKSFTAQQLVFDTTFCGDWAGRTWSSSSTCAAKADTCNAYVQNNPEAFKEAYWSVNALKVYQVGDGATSESAAPSTYTATSTSMVYVTQPSSSSYVPAPTPAPTTFAYTTKSAGWAPVVGSSGVIGFQPSASCSSASSPAETGTSGFAPVVGSDGTIGMGGESAAAEEAPSSTRGGWWSTNSDGAAQWNGVGQGWSQRHARHLGRHTRRHGSRRL